MATNWFKGIDEGLSTPGGTQVALAGRFFGDTVNGNDTSGDGSPDDPYQTFTGLIDGRATPSNETWILADGFIDINSNQITPQLNNINLVAEKKHGARVQGTNATLRSRRFNSSSVCNAFGLVFTDGVLGAFRGIQRTDCVYIYSAGNTNNDIVSVPTSAIAKPTFYKNCIFINCNHSVSRLSTNPVTDEILYENCTFIGDWSWSENASLTGSDSYGLRFVNCDMGNATLSFTDFLDVSRSEITNCNFRGTQTNTETPANLIPETDNIDVDPLYVGDPNDLEFIIQPTSPLIGAGQNGTTIGDFKVGELVDLSSPAENNNITVGATIEVGTPIPTGNIKPQLKTLSQVRISPIIKNNGLPDNRDNIPNFDIGTFIPEKLKVNVLWRETVGGADQTGTFVYGLPMYVDDSGNYVGEDDFDAFDISSTGDILNNPDNLTSANIIRVAQIQPDFIFNLNLIQLALDYGSDAGKGNFGWEGSDDGGGTWNPLGFNGPDELEMNSFPTGALNRRLVDAQNDLSGFGRYRYTYQDVNIFKEVIRFEIREADGVTVIASGSNHGNTGGDTLGVTDSIEFTTASNTFYTYMVVVSTGVGVSCRMNSDLIEDLGKP